MLMTNFAHQNVNSRVTNIKHQPLTQKTMSTILIILCVFAWLGQALKDGADI